jgi:acyl dehydratase
VSRTFDETEVGESFATTVTVTETHIVLAAGLFGDFAPLHVNEEYAKTTRFGTRIAHGTLVGGFIGAALAGHFGTGALGYLEEHVFFRAPVFPGDTVTTTWTVAEKVAKPKLGNGGIVKLSVEVTRQDGTVVLDGSGAMIVGNPQ